ncbi:MAG: DUF4398 domain-containing protein [Halofilum sp. (in: g-proteobacteria)]|nr:DUF4398 domain-containing protein [Halofilum sp. (in: g-proteobacteria)]
MHSLRPGKLARGLLLFAILLGGCASAPYQQMSDARQAVEAARPVVADQPDERAQLQEAREMLARAEEHLRAGEYEHARRLAEKARDMAIAARRAVEEGAE